MVTVYRVAFVTSLPVPFVVPYPPSKHPCAAAVPPLSSGTEQSPYGHSPCSIVMWKQHTGKQTDH